jgi:hypothetical protein
MKNKTVEPRHKVIVDVTNYITVIVRGYRQSRQG